jgi:hypothetical protein
MKDFQTIPSAASAFFMRGFCPVTGTSHDPARPKRAPIARRLESRESQKAIRSCAYFHDNVSPTTTYFMGLILLKVVYLEVPEHL